MEKVQLDCLHDDLHALHVALDRTRKNAENVKVSKAASTALLLDHGRLIRYASGDITGIR